MIEKFNKLKVDNTNKLLKLINPILTKFSNDNDISIILQKKNLIIDRFYQSYRMRLVKTKLKRYCFY